MPSPKTKKVRQIQRPKYKSFKVSKRLKQPKHKLPKARVMFVNSIKHLWKYNKVFGGITAIYLVLTIVLVKGFSMANDVPAIKESIVQTFSGAGGQLAAGATIFGVLLGGVSGVSSDVAGVYQSILLIIVSLAVIWTLRQTHAAKSVRVRDGFYRGMYPLIPFLLVLLVIGLQFIPLAFSSWLLSVTVLSGLAVTAVEQVLWVLLCFLLALLSLYLVCSSVFALYVVTLPDMSPMKALRSTGDIVLYRRWEVMRKVLFLPVVIVLIGAIIMLPVILWLTPLAEWLFFALSMLALAVSHSYIYSLYRELL